MSKEGFKGSRVQGSKGFRTIKEELESSLLMNIYDLNVRDMDVVVMEPKGGDQLRVLDVTYDHKPLRAKIRGYVSGNVDSKYNPPTMIVQLDLYTIERLSELEKLYVRNHPAILKSDYKFRSCIIDDKYIRIKLRAGKLGRQFQFTTNKRDFTPQGLSEIYDGLGLDITVDPKFYFSKDHFGMFLQVNHIDFP
jgi:hypothetical protein